MHDRAALCHEKSLKSKSTNFVIHLFRYPVFRVLGSPYAIIVSFKLTIGNAICYCYCELTLQTCHFWSSLVN